MARRLTNRQIDAISLEVQKKINKKYQEEYKQKEEAFLQTPEGQEFIDLLIKFNNEISDFKLLTINPRTFDNSSTNYHIKSLYHTYIDNKIGNVKHCDYVKITNYIALSDMNETINIEEWIDSLVENLK